MTADPTASRRRPGSRFLLVLGALVVLVLVVVLAGPRIYAWWGDRNTPPELSVTSAPGTAPASPAGPIETDGTWTLRAGTTAGYRVDEVLRGEDVTVVGRTESVTGTVTVADGSLTAVDATVDVASIATGVGPRDSFMRELLETETHPTATFRIDAPVTLPSLETGGSIEVPGVLTLRGTEHPLTFTLDVVRDGDGLRAAGSAPVTFSDLGLEAPSLGFVEVEDAGTLELLLVLGR
ncbi:YceI family protein [Sanguibacter sp. A247]|uniref:YceI family protein n=1 Tax=unclassified Sanguibacter TaxID=2645534 RepID=UPI003FD72DB9